MARTPKFMPYTATTATGTRIEADLPLHPETASPVRVNQMLDALLGLIDREVRMDPATSNGDVLQALAMALALRGTMIEAPKQLTDRLAAELLADTLTALDAARIRSTPGGTA